MRTEQLAYFLIQINLLAYLRTLSNFGKFVITIIFVFLIDRCALNCNTYSNLIYLVIFIFLIPRTCRGNHARFALFRTSRQKEFSKCDNSNIVEIKSIDIGNAITAIERDHMDCFPTSAAS